MTVSNIRGFDCQGAGYFGAPRGDRVHKGIDFVDNHGDYVRSLNNGVVTKIGYPYSPTDKEKSHFRYIQVTDGSGFECRYFYIDPILTVGAEINVGDVIGKAQNLKHVYPGITQHFHFEVKRSGEYMNPNHYLEGRL